MKIDCLDKISDPSLIIAQGGELFAKVPLNENLTEDSDAGKLILTSVRKVFFAPKDNSDKVVYEAAIVRADNFDFDGRGKEYLYLCLSATSVRSLGLTKGSSLSVEIQFQMDRMMFCMMQHSIDQLSSIDIVFPDISKLRPLYSERHDLKVRYVYRYSNLEIYRN